MEATRPETGANRPTDDEGQRLEVWARQRIREITADAAAATKALGLPPERTFDVLRVLYGARQSVPTSEQQPSAGQQRVAAEPLEGQH